MTSGNGVILFDASGNPVALSPAAAVPVSQPGLMHAGSDYAASPKAQLFKVDGSGQQYQVSVAPNGQSMPVQVNASTPANAAAYGQISLAWCPSLNNNAGGWTPFQVDATGAGVVRQALAPTFSASATATTGTSAGKSIISFFNAGPMTQRLMALFTMCPPQLVTSGSSGLLGGSTSTNYTQIGFATYRTTGHSGGTLAVPVAHDPADTLDTGLTVRVNGATVTGEGANSLGTWDAAYDAEYNPVARIDQNIKALTMPPGTGIHVKCISALSSSVLFYLRCITAQNVA